MGNSFDLILQIYDRSAPDDSEKIVRYVNGDKRDVILKRGKSHSITNEKMNELSKILKENPDFPFSRI